MASDVNGNVSVTGAGVDSKVETVNGDVDLTFPADLNADVRGETVNDGIQSSFPITIAKGFGPKSYAGRIGNGGNGGRRLNIETVNGGIALRKKFFR